MTGVTNPLEALTDDLVEFARVPNPHIPNGTAWSDSFFALKAKGDSLIDEGIREGDVILVQPAQTAKDGETVVALIGSKACVRKLYREDGAKVRLDAENKSLPPIITSAEEVAIRGRVVAVIRKY